MPVWQKLLVACLIIFGTALFPFETALGKLPPQTEEAEKPVKKTGKKKTSKKKKKYQISFKGLSKCDHDININESYVLGYTSTIEQKTPALVTENSPIDNSHTDTTFIQSPYNQHSDKKQEPPAAPLSSQALMPVAFTVRRKKKNS